MGTRVCNFEVCNFEKHSYGNRGRIKPEYVSLENVAVIPDSQCKAER